MWDHCISLNYFSTDSGICDWSGGDPSISISWTNAKICRCSQAFLSHLPLLHSTVRVSDCLSRSFFKIILRQEDLLHGNNCSTPPPLKTSSKYWEIPLKVHQSDSTYFQREITSVGCGWSSSSFVPRNCFSLQAPNNSTIDQPTERQSDEWNVLFLLVDHGLWDKTPIYNFIA